MVTFSKNVELMRYEAQAPRLKTFPILPPNEFGIDIGELSKDFVLDLVWGYQKTLITDKYTDKVKRTIDKNWNLITSESQQVFKDHGKAYGCSGLKLFRYVYMTSLCRYTSQHARNWLTKFREEIRILGKDLREIKEKNIFIRVFFPSNWALYCEPTYTCKTQALGHKVYKFGITRVMSKIRQGLKSSSSLGVKDSSIRANTIVKSILSDFKINRNFLSFVRDIFDKQNVDLVASLIKEKSEELGIRLKHMFFCIKFDCLEAMNIYPDLAEFVDKLNKAISKGKFTEEQYEFWLENREFYI